jgi:WD40 repeat protein
MIATVSEDATCKIWEIPNDLEEVKETKVFNRSIETLKGHMGRNIRALTCHQGLVATGGDDGAIKVWNAVEIINKK